MLKYAVIMALAVLIIPVASAWAESMDSPRKQMETVSAEMVQCREGQVLVIKTGDGSPACVKPTTKALLIERGWAHEAEQHMDEMKQMDDVGKTDSGTDMSDSDNMMDSDKVGTIDAVDVMEPNDMTDAMTDSDTAGSAGTGGSGMSDSEETLDLDLTEAEMMWLNDNTIKAIYDPTWAPIEYRNDDGELDGLSKKYLVKLGEILNKDIETVDVNNWEEVLEGMKNGDGDIVFMVAETDDRLEYMGFTTPHTRIIVNIITTTEQEISPDELTEYKVATVKGYAVEAWLDENHPDIAYISVDDVATGIDELSMGNVDVFLGALPIVTYHANIAEVDVYSAGDLGYEYALSIGYRNDIPELGSILEKTLATISEQQRDEMLAEIITS